MIAPPPLDVDGLVIPHDHEDIKSEDEIIRRISHHFIVTNADGRRVISSMAYKASSGKYGGMSVDLKQLIEQAGKDPKIYVTNPRWMGSVLFKVFAIRKLNYQVGYHPITGPDPNPYHGEVWGKFSRDDIEQFKNLAKWFVPIENVDTV